MFSSFAKRTQLTTIIETLYVRSSQNIICATNSTTNGVQLTSRRFIFKNYAIGNCDYQSANFVKSHNNYCDSILKKNTSRPLSTLDHSSLVGANLPAIINNEKRDLLSVFPDIVRELSEIAAQKDPICTPRWFTRSLEYNIARDTLYRGIFTVLAFRTLAKPEMITPENIRLAQYLGWCTELLNSSLILIDDIMYDGEIRRGSPCWYKLDDVKLMAVNDAFMIENSLYMLLKKHFCNTSYCTNMYELFHEAAFNTCCGKLLDVPRIGVGDFTMELYSTMAQFRTSFYSIYLPIALAMHLAGYTDPEMFRQAKEIPMQLGELIQIQNDITDCFGNPNLTGRIGNDIERGALTWLSTLCMQRANEEQKNIMRENYGKPDPEKVASIKKLYEELDLRNAYLNYEKELFSTIEIGHTPIERSDTFIKLKQLVFTIFIKNTKW